MFGSAKRSNFGSRRVVFELDAANSTTSASVMPVVGSESENDDGDEGVVGSESDVGDVAGPPAPSRPPRQGGLKVYIIIASAAAAWMPHWCPPGFEKGAPPDGSFLVGAAVGEWNFQTEPAAEEASYMVHQALRKASRASEIMGFVVYTCDIIMRLVDPQLVDPGTLPAPMTMVDPLRGLFRVATCFAFVVSFLMLRVCSCFGFMV